eukprot:scaffold2447_cov110-Cylindrotheca_fusiformis.AAC.9
MKLSISLLLLLQQRLFLESHSFSVLPKSTTTKTASVSHCSNTEQQRRHVAWIPLHSTSAEGGGEVEKEKVVDDIQNWTPEEKKKAVGNLVADDEWEGLGMELTELVRVAVLEDLKQNARNFLGKDDYKIGDISKKIDDRVKTEVAKVRNKDDYELGDFVMAMDEMSKSLTEDLTGKPYEAGDLSIELDRRVKATVAQFCGKEEYEFGDLTKEIDNRVKSRVADFTGKEDYEFGDITKEIGKRRKAWVKDFLGEEAAENYQFGDVTKKAITSFTGKDDYQFGDITKKIAGNLFGPRKGKEKKEEEK